MKHKVFIKTDIQGNVIQIVSDYFVENTDGYIYIDEGEGDRFIHVQHLYLDEPLYNDSMIPNYKYIGGAIQKRDDTDIAKDADNRKKIAQQLCGTSRILGLEKMVIDLYMKHLTTSNGVPEVDPSLMNILSGGM